MQKKNPLVKPYLKWAGGKRQLLPEIKKYIPKQLNRLQYYEPFVGAGAVFFDAQPKRAVINDYNSQLIMTYNTIVRNIDGLLEVLRMHRSNNSEKYFYEIRSQDRDAKAFASLTNTEKSARLIYLNKTCYNGLYRVNSQGLFNSPYGRYQNPAICDEPVLRAIHNYLSSNENEIEISSEDFAVAVQTANHQSFVYFDPPYHSPDNTNFTGYQADKFDDAEQTRLRDTFADLTGRGVKCLLSNSDTKFIRELYANDEYDIISVLAKRAINSDSAGRGNVNEVLIKNWR
ncbi:MAG: DNA adenine methylase [Zoogloeaceae bacterium]|jgi:DNA adenine methylase|nr:DNA adenine methylase [Zoogloeaceae bacterium]